MGKILGLSFFYHDSAAALLIDGWPAALAQEERFSRKKNDSGFPERAIDFVLQEGGVKPEDLDCVVFYEKPFLKLERIMKTNLRTFPLAPLAFAESTKNFFSEKMWVRQIISEKLKIPPEKVLFSEHHLSHAASAYFASPYDKAAILTVDGVGEWAVTTVGVGDGNKITILKEIRFPHSLGLLYSAFTAFLGFEVNEGEYKVMGMAPYGQPRYVADVEKMIRWFGDGSYALCLKYFSYHRSVKRTFSKEFIRLFGKPRDPKSKFFTRETGWPSYFGDKPAPDRYETMAVEQERYADIAASIQAVLEKALIRLAKQAQQLTGLDKLCFAGGVALNCSANWKILENTPFKEIFIQPAAGDAGGALGAALAVHNIGPYRRRGTGDFVMKHAYYGKNYSSEEIKNFLENNHIKYRYIEDENDLINDVIKNIADGKVIGWFHGKFEWGPRALGARSIIADPRRAEMKDVVNTKIKFREPYRPFAPSVLAEFAEEIFEMPGARNHYPARFMLYVVRVRSDQQKRVPAITHVDGSARPQLIFKEESPRYYRLIEKFRELTGVPLLLNTSFNLKGEPIVGSPEDAYSTFQRSGLDVLVLENFIVDKKENS